MKIEVAAIKILGGEYKVLTPEDAGLHPVKPGDEAKSTLVVGARFALLNKKGIVVAEGICSNAPNAAPTTARLSQETLTAFQNFFSCLENDVANAFLQDEKATSNDPLADLLGNRG